MAHRAFLPRSNRRFSGVGRLLFRVPRLRLENIGFMTAGRIAGLAPRPFNGQPWSVVNGAGRARHVAIDRHVVRELAYPADASPLDYTRLQPLLELLSL